MDYSKMRPTDKYLKQLLDESYKQESKHHVVKLPCGCTSIELDKPQDVSGMCNICFKPFQLIWQRQPKFRGIL